MIAKFTRGTDHRLGIRFEPQTFEEQLLLEMFAQGTKDYDFKFSSWESNGSGRERREGLTSVWGELVEQQQAIRLPTVRMCTCLGSCGGAARLAPGWRCALEAKAAP